MKMESLNTTATRPRWAGSYGERLTLLSGGAKLNGANFPLVNGKRSVPSGTCRMRLVHAVGHSPLPHALSGYSECAGMLLHLPATHPSIQPPPPRLPALLPAPQVRQQPRHRAHQRGGGAAEDH